MASVQELLLAAEAKKKVNPLLELLQTGISGYQTGQGIAKTSSDIRDKNLDIAIKLIQKQQLEQDIINKQKNQEFLRKQIGLQEEETKNEFNRTSPNPNPTIRSEKLKKKITMNEKGDLEGSFETIEPKELKVPETLEELLAKEVREGRMSLEDALKSKKPSAMDSSMQREVTKAKVEVAKTRPMVESVVKEIERVELLNDNSYGGKTGQAKMAVKSALELGTDDPKFKNTADVINTMQSQVSKVLKSTFGGQLSDGEREYLNGVYGALPGLSRSERSVAMKNVKKMLQARLSGNIQTLKELLEDAGIEPRLADSYSGLENNEMNDESDLSKLSDEELDEQIAKLKGDK